MLFRELCVMIHKTASASLKDRKEEEKNNRETGQNRDVWDLSRSCIYTHSCGEETIPALT